MLVHIKRKRSEKIGDAVNVIMIIVFLLLISYPLYYLVVASVSDIHEITQEPFLMWAKGFTLEHYQRVLSKSSIWTGFRNSIMYTTIGVTINIGMTILAAYPLSRKDLKGRKTILKIIIITMYISGGLVPTYLVVKNLGMLNSFWVMVIPNAVNAFYIIIAKSYFENSIPYEIQEAAIIDGCNNFQLLLKIILPISTPLIGVLVIYYGLAHWNTFSQALIFLTDRDRHPLQLVLREILVLEDSKTMMTMMGSGLDYSERVKVIEGTKYVSMVVSSLPLLIMYPFFQKFFTSGITLGAVKG